MYGAEVKLYRGKAPTYEQVTKIDEKLKRIVMANFVRDLKIKNQKPLSDMIDEVMKSNDFKKQKAKIISDAINSSKQVPVVAPNAKPQAT